jgi:hypothetical protein
LEAAKSWNFNDLKVRLQDVKLKLGEDDNDDPLRIKF